MGIGDRKEGTSAGAQKPRRGPRAQPHPAPPFHGPGASSPSSSALAEPAANAPGWRDLGAGGDDAKASAPPKKVFLQDEDGGNLAGD